jgi:tRNA(fMet)-specific endonuclease VapC
MIYLLDTNICIYLINNKYDYLIDKIESLGIENIALSTLTIAELEFGIAKSKSNYKEENRLALLEFLIPFRFLAFEQNDAYEYGILREDLQRKGLIIGNMDMLIAAQAMANNLILVTNNVSEFQKIDDLKIENWIK